MEEEGLGEDGEEGGMERGMEVKADGEEGGIQGGGGGLG